MIMKRWRTRHRHGRGKIWTWAKWWQAVDEIVNDGAAKKARRIVDKALRSAR